MRQAFTILYSKIVLEILLVTGVVALVVGRLRRRLRVHPEQATRAPMLWLVNMTADARLHRRLRRVAARIRQSARSKPSGRRMASTSPLQRLLFDLEAEVVRLDDQLVSAHDADFDTQRSIIIGIRADADRIDGLIDRIESLAVHQAETPMLLAEDDPIDAVADKLTELEDRHARHGSSVIDTSGRAESPRAIDTTSLDSST